MIPKDIYVLIPRTCEYIILHGNSIFVDVITLRILRWRDYLWLSWWAWFNHKCPLRGWQEVAQEREDTKLLALKMEEGFMSQRREVASKSWKRQENRFSPIVSGRNAVCVPILDFWLQIHNSKFVLFLATKIAAVSYSDNRKLLHLGLSGVRWSKMTSAGMTKVAQLSSPLARAHRQDDGKHESVGKRKHTRPFDTLT